MVFSFKFFFVLLVCCFGLACQFISNLSFPLGISFYLSRQAIDHIINSAAKSNYMSAGQISVPIVFRGPNGAAAGVGAQHSQVCFSLALFVHHLS
jgi:hypothetical protein